MTLSIGDRLPDATFLEMGEGGPRELAGRDLLAGRKVVVFGVPGAYTGTCSAQHVPSFIRVADALAGKGVDEVFCLAVNDPFVLKAWGEATGADRAGIRMLADPASTFTRAIGMEFDWPPSGFHGRSKRYAMLVEDGAVKVLNIEESRGSCELSSGEAMLEAL